MGSESVNDRDHDGGEAASSKLEEGQQQQQPRQPHGAARPGGGEGAEDEDDGAAPPPLEVAASASAAASAAASSLPLPTLSDALRYKREGNAQVALCNFVDAERSYVTGLDVVGMLRGKKDRATMVEEETGNERGGGGDDSGDDGDGGRRPIRSSLYKQRQGRRQEAATTRSNPVGSASHAAAVTTASSAPPAAVDDVDLPTLTDTEVALRSNLALTLSRLNRHSESKDQCTAALRYDPTNAKLWYRRAQAKEEMTQNQQETGSESGLRGAERDLVRCIELLTAATTATDGGDVAKKSRQGGNNKRNKAQQKTNKRLDARALKDARTALGRVRERLAAADSAAAAQSVGAGGVGSSRAENQQRQHQQQQQQLNDDDDDDADRKMPPAMNGAPSSPDDTHRDAPSAPDDDDSTPPVTLPPPREQRANILRLLAAQPISPDSAHSRGGGGGGNSGNGAAAGSNANAQMPPRTPHDGEAYFLVNATWWNVWTKHVDFFRDAELAAAKTAEGGVNKKALAPANKKAAMAEAWRGRLQAQSLMPAGASVPAPAADAGTVKKRRSSSSSSSSSSSEESQEEGWRCVEGAAGPRPDVIDNSDLILHTDGTTDGGTTGGGGESRGDAHDEFFAEWCRPSMQQSASEGEGGAEEEEAGGSGTSAAVRLRPNLVRGHHFEVLPREAYGALTCWYGEATPGICRRASVPRAPVAANAAKRGEGRTEDNGGGEGVEGRVRLLLYPELQLGPLDSSQSTSSSSRPPINVAAASSGAAGGARCGACRTPGARSRCTSCLSVRYCRRECQMSHWPYHKAACKTISRSLQVKVEEEVAGGRKESAKGEVVQQDDDDEDPDWGRVGLNNLGNTCFMNSALQCLSHAAPLTKHFLTNRYKSDLNVTNPLGSGGKLAVAYDTAIKELWMSGARRTLSISPTSLKRAIALFAPRFAGTSQHDSHEFLAYLLDALHEDLNRVRDAPYVEMPDAAPGQKLTIAGAEAWDAHRRRNDSLIMDTFYGQFKSTCVCPQCDRVSVSFDAYNHVSLEIPQLHNSTRVIPITLVRSAGASTSGGGAATDPVRYGLVVSRDSVVGDLKLMLAKMCGVPPARLSLCDVYEHTVYEILQDNRDVSKIRADDVLVAYEIHPYTEKTIHAVAAQAWQDGDDRAAASEGAKRRFGFPIVTSFSANASCAEVWGHLWAQVSRWLTLADGKGDEICGTTKDKKACLQIRITDNKGKPRSVFRGVFDDGVGVDSAEIDLTSLLPRSSNVKLTDALGNDCVERFLFLSLEWADHPESGVDYAKFNTYSDHPTLLGAYQKQKALNGRTVTLDKCFETFTRPERLDENNKWYCSSCKEHVRAMKTMELWGLPNVLVVHLKRFEYKHALRRDKLETFVDFPLEGLDMSHYCAHPNTTVPSSASNSQVGGNGAGKSDDSDFVIDSIPAMYDLFGVTNHYGRMGFGHYTAYARRWNESGIDDDWALFDDSSVRNVGDGTGRGGGDGMVVTPAAYMLFYRRRVFT